jgi:hypothetical protein
MFLLPKETTIQITRVSSLTNVRHTRDIDINAEQLCRWLSGELIQNVAGHLSADDREFLLTGTTPEEWDAAFKEA